MVSLEARKSEMAVSSWAGKGKWRAVGRMDVTRSHAGPRGQG